MINNSLSPIYKKRLYFFHHILIYLDILSDYYNGNINYIGAVLLQAPYIIEFVNSLRNIRWQDNIFNLAKINIRGCFRCSGQFVLCFYSFAHVRDKEIRI